MPRVRPIEQRTVDESSALRLQPMTGNKVASGANANSFGADVAKAVQEGGAARMAASEFFADRELDRMKRENEARAKDAEQAMVEFERSALYDPKTGYYSKKGRDAVEGREAVVEALKKKAEEISETLKSPYAKEVFRDAVTPRISARSIDVDRYSSAQQSAWEAAQSKSRIEGATDDAIAAAVGPDGRPDTQQIGLNSALALNEIHERADREGWPPEQRKEALEQVQSTIHRGVVARLLAQPGGAVEAEKYYKANKDEVSGIHQSEIEASLKDGLETADAISEADRIVESAILGAKKANQTFYQSAREQDPKVRVSDWFPDAMEQANRISDPRLREKVRGKVISRAKQEQAVQDQKDLAAWERAVDHVDAGGNPDDLPYEIKDTIGIEKLNALRSQYELAGQSLTTIAGRELIDRLFTGTPEEIVAIDLREHRQDLSRADYNTAVSIQKAAKEAVGGNVPDFDPRNAQIRGYMQTLLEAAGLDGSNHKARRGEIAIHVVNALSAAAKKKGAGLTFDEQKAIVDRLMMTVGKPSTIAGYEISEGDKLLEIETIDDIPEEDRENIAEVLRENKGGVEPTDKEVIDVYLQYKLRGN